MKYVLAIDIGNSGGRCHLGWLEKGKLQLQEVHSFDNNTRVSDGTIYWQPEELFQQVLLGLARCKELGMTPEAVSIDTWGLDFVLFDREGREMGPPVNYRDNRTVGMMEELFQIVPKREVYDRTGIQFMRFNTLYQFYYLSRHQPELLKEAQEMLMIPDYLNWRLTGRKMQEYTNATTTQMLNCHTKDWDREMLDRVGIPHHMLLPVRPPQTRVGGFLPEIREQLGFDAQVLLSPSHDTASAYVAAPNLRDDSIILSSGTWSLLGTELSAPMLNDAAYEYNFANEGGIDYRYRFLKNITGMWMMQQVRRNYDKRYSYREFDEMAAAAGDFPSAVDVDDEAFVNPASMIQAIQDHCRRTGQRVPETPGEITVCINNSLSRDYREKIHILEECLGRRFSDILLVGGGCNNKLLNQAVANTTGKPVFAGPRDATGIGNALNQLIALGEVPDLHTGRQMIAESFPISRYSPQK